MQPARRIAVLIDGNAASSDLHVGIASYARHHPQWELYPLWDKRSEMLRQLPHPPDGVIAMAFEPEIIHGYAELPVPLVNVLELHDPAPVPVVCGDSFAGGQMVASHLLEQGIRNLAAFGFGGRAGPDAATRLAGLCDMAAQKGLSVAVSDIAYPYGWTDIEQFWDRIGHWMRSLDKPLGIATQNDLFGARLIKAADLAGLHVPDDVAIVGYDNAQLHCLSSSPQLSSLDPNRVRIGYEAAQWLDRLLDGEAFPKTPVRVPPTGVVARASTDVIAIQDPLVSAAVRFIRDHAREDISAADVYRAAHASRATVQPRFREALGHTVSEEIWRTRLSHACLLLTETDMPLVEIVEASGFTSVPHFCRRFREHLGRTPKEYRLRRMPPGR
jgi:LacI family transcriptional regulator